MAPEVLSCEDSIQSTTERTHSVARFIATGALALAGGSFAGAMYSAESPTDIKIGPHNATAQITESPNTVIDLGPIGRAEKPTGWEIGGVKVVVKDIPAQTDGDPLGSASSTVDAYEQLLADPKHIKEAAVHTVITRIWHDGVAGGALFGASSIALLGATMHRKKREEQKQASAINIIDSLGDAIDNDQRSVLVNALQPPKHSRSRLCSGIILTSLLATTVCSDAAVQPKAPATVETDQVLNGTPFEGYTLHGALLQLLVDQGGGRLKSFIDANDAFYEQTTTNFNKKFTEQFQDLPLNHSGLTYILSISDNHCNIGMDEVDEAAAKDFGVAATLDNGDTTMSGSMAEEECVSAEADALRTPKRPLIIAPGNHDNGDDGHGSTPLQGFAAKHGVNILTLGKTVNVAGLTITGAADPMQSTMGTPIHQHGNQSIADVASKLAAYAQATHPDIVAGHEPGMVELTASQGNAGFVIAGHTHTFSPPVKTNENTGTEMMTEGTSGGVEKDTFTIGPLRNTAVETALVFDTSTKRAIGYYLIQAQPNVDVSISDFLPIDSIIVPPQLEAASQLAR